MTRIHRGTLVEMQVDREHPGQTPDGAAATIADRAVSAPPLWIERRGNPASPAVVFLHGFLGDGSDWAPVVDLVEDQFHCLLVDLPGHGRSAPPESSAAFARDLREALPHHLSGPFILCGYSMGARLALAALGEGLGPATGLILESCRLGLSNPAERSARLEHDLALSARLRFNPAAFLREWYGQPLFASPARHPALLSRIRQGARTTINAPARRGAGGVQPGAHARRLAGAAPERPVLALVELDAAC
ncbi:MAG: alpha/beta fold hydrolase [Kiritimatiellia bacterium]